MALGWSGGGGLRPGPPAWGGGAEAVSSFGSGSLGRPWRGRFWSSSPTALGFFFPSSRPLRGTRQFTRQALIQGFTQNSFLALP